MDTCRVPKQEYYGGNSLTTQRYDGSDNPVAFTTKSILEDDVYLYPAEFYVPQETGWFVVEAVGANESCIQYCSRGHVPCKSYRDTIRSQDSGLSFLALAELVLVGYRNSIRTLKAMIHNQLFKWSPDVPTASSGVPRTFFIE